MCQMNKEGRLVMLLLSLSLSISAMETTLPKALRFTLVGDSTVAHDQGWGNAFLDRLTGEVSHNTFTEQIPMSDRDFISLDEAQIQRPRQPDGSLPTMTLLHFAEGSRLINVGKDVGLYYRGAHPDLGTFEY